MFQDELKMFKPQFLANSIWSFATLDIPLPKPLIKRIKKMYKHGEWDATMTIISDRHVPFSLLSQVMYTAGQAQYSKFKFMVVKGA